ncbi:MAG: type II toxin-antitoxin system VapC family toxin [Nitrospira sp.]|nr:type II toxin-antitoxin system VapC family toxin [Nitrospira sp.]
MKWFVEERGVLAARTVLARGETLLVPELVLVEASNTAWKKVKRREITPEQGEAMMRVIPLYFDRLVESDILIARAYALATRLNHRVYDCLYLALAEMESITMITDDTRLIKAVAGTEFRKRVRQLERFSG